MVQEEDLTPARKGEGAKLAESSGCRVTERIVEAGKESIV